jgi:hypothetical protein
MTQALDQQAGPLYAARPTVLYLPDEKASKDKIAMAFAEIAVQAGPDDVFLFYYCGHGHQYEDPKSKVVDPGQRCYLLPHGFANSKPNLAELRAIFQELLRLPRPGQREDAIEHRPEPSFLHEEDPEELALRPHRRAEQLLQAERLDAAVGAQRHRSHRGFPARSSAVR